MSSTLIAVRPQLQSKASKNDHNKSARLLFIPSGFSHTPEVVAILVHHTKQNNLLHFC